ncbi:hypothetical protein [Hyphomonas sp.]|uniref:hypothetical protein n=1 Tax=Hyphomonas sp. TaxID=87 RepID=UPI002629EBB1|nr:hypothetical protein [Hyphomonas sp.]MDF1807944.1 hypothetical protein [Hyphomonas sp.]
MDDIVERLRVPCIEFGLDEGWIDAERKEAANKIETLEARIAKADALADVSETLATVSGTKACHVIAALAAYREGSET